MADQPEQIDREQRLNRVLAEYLEASETGTAPDRTTLLIQHADLAGDLDAFLAARDHVDRLAAPFRRESFPTPTPGKPRSFGDYDLLAVVGRGGMGVVYRAHQKSLDRRVAVKLIHPLRRIGDADVQRFRNEAEAAAQLDHPGIVPIYEVGQHDGHLFFSMRLIEGGSLARLKDRSLSVRAAAELVAEVARAVQHAHERGILHRDLKPSNILLDGAGRPYVADFGLAKQLSFDSELTQTGALVGTPAYMAPEQAAPTPTPSLASGIDRPRQATTAVDIYGLGAILYALLTGQPPFRGQSPLDTLALVTGHEPVPPSRFNANVDRDLEAICLKCLEKEPARRFRSAADVAADLERWLAGEPTLARPLGQFDRAHRWCRRNPALAVMAGAIVSLLLAGITALGFGLVAVNAARREAFEHLLAAQKRAAELRIREYASDMGRAYQHWRQANPKETSALLDRYVTQPGESELRGFEWYFLHGQLPDRYPQRVVWRGHTDIVYSAALSPDGRMIASGGADRQIRLWDATTGECLAVLDPPHEDDVNWLVFSPDGRTLASAGDDDAIRLWKVADRRQAAVLKSPSPMVECVVFSPDGANLASAGSDGAVRLWNVADRRIEQTWTSHQQVDQGTRLVGVEMLAWSPDGKLLASAGHDGFVTLFDVAAREVERRLEVGNNALAVTFSPDSRRFAVGDRQGEVSLWNIDGSQVWKGWEHINSVRDLHFLRDDSGRDVLLSCGDDGTVRSWAGADGDERDQIISGQRRLWSLDALPDGQSLVTASEDSLVKLWDRTKMAARQSLPLTQSDFYVVISVEYSPDGKTLAIGSRSGGVGLWDVAQGRLRGVLIGHAGDVTSLSFSPDSQLLATAAVGEPVVVWRLAPDRPASPGPGDVVLDAKNAVVFAGNNGLVTAADEELVHYDWPSRQITGRLATKEADTGWFAVKSLAASSDGRWIAIGRSDNHIQLWCPKDGATRMLPGHHGRLIWKICFSPDGTHLASTSLDGTARFWDLDDGRIPTILNHEKGFSSVAFTPDGKTLAAGRGDSAITLLHVATRQEMLSLHRHPGSLVDLAFSPDGQTLVTGGHQADVGVPYVLLWHARRDSGPPVDAKK
jgi:WD40 repeat protein